MNGFYLRLPYFYPCEGSLPLYNYWQQPSECYPPETHRLQSFILHSAKLPINKEVRGFGFAQLIERAPETNKHVRFIPTAMYLIQTRSKGV